MKDYTEPNFLCIVKGDTVYLEKIKECIQEYVEKELVSLVTSTINKKEVHILTEKEWEEYQNLKKKEDKLIGAWFP